MIAFCDLTMYGLGAKCWAYANTMVAVCVLEQSDSIASHVPIET